MNSLSEYHWKGFKYDGFPVNTQPILVGEEDLLLTDYDHVLACLQSRIRDRHRYSDLLLEFKQIHGHIDRHLNEVVFVKCENRSCCDEFRSKVAKEILEQRGDSLRPHQTEIRKDIIILFSKKYLIKKSFLVMKVNPQQWKKILAGATFVQIFLSNQPLKEQDIKAGSTADKNKVLTKNGSLAVPFQVAN